METADIGEGSRSGGRSRSCTSAGPEKYTWHIDGTVHPDVGLATLSLWTKATTCPFRPAMRPGALPWRRS